MKINFIELTKFKRFRLNSIDHFKLDADAITQVILGTNGSGKSSLLNEVTPLPPSKDDYLKGGGKTIEIEDKGDHYRLCSIFGGGGKEHSFIKNGDEELNPGGTITVQRQLVESVFGITPEIHNLMLGKERFTTMSPGRRREWLTRLPEVDYYYALGVYEKARVRLRDVSGALNIAKERLVKERTKAADAQEVGHHQERVRTLTDEITRMYRSRSPDGPSANSIHQEMGVLQATTQTSYDKYLELRKSVNWLEFVLPDEVTDHISECKGRLAGVVERVTQLTTEHHALDEQLKTVRDSGDQSIGGIKTQQEELVKRKQDLLLSLNYKDLGITDPEAAQSAFLGVMDSLVDIFGLLPPNPDKKYSPHRINELRESVDKAKHALQSFEQKAARLEHECEHQDQVLKTGMISCPSCKHAFSPGYDMEKHNRYKTALTTGREAIAKKKAELTAFEEDLELNVNYWNLFRPFSQYMSSIKILKPLWDLLTEDNLIFNIPANGVIVLIRFEEDLKTLMETVKLDKEHTRLNDLMILAERASQVDVESASKKATAIEDELGRLANAQAHLQKTINESQQQVNAVNRILQMEPLFREYGKQYNQLSIKYFEAMINEELDTQIRERQIKVAQHQYQLNTFKEHASVIESIEKSITELEQQETAMKLVVASLSPKEGLIAEGIVGFMRNLVRKMNVVIKSIWTYDMEVLACGLSEDGTADLDYKFPVAVHNPDAADSIYNEKPSKDVSETSAGMMEVIDLAFKIVAMHYLGLDKAPLILDEFGVRFDHQHRINATYAIKNLMEQLSFSQLWLVSHYEESYMCFTNAQICVLSAANIMTPEQSEFNKHVIIA